MWARKIWSRDGISLKTKMQFNNDNDKTQLACEPKLVFEEYVTQPQRLCSQASIKFHEPQCERKAKAEEERKQRWCHNHHHNHQKREIVFTLRPSFWFFLDHKTFRYIQFQKIMVTNTKNGSSLSSLSQSPAIWVTLWSFRQKEAEAAEEKPVSYMDHIGLYLECKYWQDWLH